MKIAFIGAGNVATGLGKLFAKSGHELFFSHSRDQEKLKRQAASVSSTAKTGTATEAAKWADLLVLTTPYEAAPEALKAAGDLAGKTVWSVINPFKPDYSGLQVGTTTSGAEELAKLVPDASFVGALPPFAEVLHAEELPANTSSVFVYSNDEVARGTVLKLLSAAGLDSVDAGDLFAARFFEPAMFGLVYLTYARKQPGVGLRLVRSN